MTSVDLLPFLPMFLEVPQLTPFKSAKNFNRSPKKAKKNKNNHLNLPFVIPYEPKALQNNKKKSKKSNPTKMLQKFKTQNNIAMKTVKDCASKALYDHNKIYLASTASDSDGNDFLKMNEFKVMSNGMILHDKIKRGNPYYRSPLNGFKIAFDGRIIHDEIEEDMEAMMEDMGMDESRRAQVKYASSSLVNGPNPAIISLPSFV